MTLPIDKSVNFGVANISPLEWKSAQHCSGKELNLLAEKSSLLEWKTDLAEGGEDEVHVALHIREQLPLKRLHEYCPA